MIKKHTFEQIIKRFDLTFDSEKHRDEMHRKHKLNLSTKNEYSKVIDDLVWLSNNAALLRTRFFASILTRQIKRTKKDFIIKHLNAHGVVTHPNHIWTKEKLDRRGFPSHSSIVFGMCIPTIEGVLNRTIPDEIVRIIIRYIGND